MVLLDLPFHSPAQTSGEGSLQFITHLYDTSGHYRFTDTLRIWYKDSTLAEDIRRSVTVTDTNNVTTETFPRVLFRYIDLRRKMLYDYKTFSDTSVLIRKAMLIDKGIQYYGWPVYGEEQLTIVSEPVPLPDTTMNGVHYKRSRFILVHKNPNTQYTIGYFNCDHASSMFSIVRDKSRKMDCDLVKIYDYHVGIRQPYGSMEVVPISDHLAPGELQVFNAWEQRAKKEPVISD